MGVPTLQLKLISATVMGALMGVAGAPYPYFVTFVDPQSAFQLNIAVNSIAMPMIGGTAFWYGPLVGALLLGTAQEVISVTISSEINVLLVGVVLVVFRDTGPEGSRRPVQRPAPQGQARWLSASSTSRAYQALRRLRRAERYRPPSRRGRAPGSHRPQRLRQDDDDQLHLGLAVRRRGHDHLPRRRHLAAARAPAHAPRHRAQLSDPAAVPQHDHPAEPADPHGVHRHRTAAAAATGRRRRARSSTSSASPAAPTTIRDG